VLAFYSIPSSKRSVYLLVAYPFIALIWVDYFWSCAREVTSAALKTHWWIAKIVRSLLLLLLLIGGLGPLVWPSGYLPAQPLAVLAFLRVALFSLSAWQRVSLALVLVALSQIIAIGTNVKRAWPLGLEPRILLLYLSMVMLLNTVVLPVVIITKSHRYFAEQLHKLVPPTTLVFSYEREFHDISFYSGLRFKLKSTPYFLDDSVVLEKRSLQSFNSRLGGGLRAREVVEEISPWGGDRSMLLMKIETANATDRSSGALAVESAKAGQPQVRY
jgi:hypothetical protein